ncbi:gliding motility lipoprotein GldH [Agriterribacter sp.]|uniref:gliding motility lipoprotein GldH n=1 Tax=Agriterribacter sp. TaxID=2821509 RepID=UPI002C1EE6F6|nr:gliding motility lipoprotein GldH [Agriterribacter sp.]HRO44943.1 gliding motility lipoprotein GldH [Agriterribacter sp.]HRQ15681.1 gliding motility lipoprotein GldH [Agriterribacter sp.]
MKKRSGSAVFFAVIIGSMVLCGSSCRTIDVFEKNSSIPAQEWDRAFQPVIVFNITDTAALYNIYVTLRHTHAYNYNNIWLSVNYQLPGDTVKQQRVDIPLADNSKGWLGTGMDDIYEVRRLITPQPYRFKNSGTCTFTLEQIMRENPLKHVMNAGIRVEKVER